MSNLAVLPSTVDGIKRLAKTLKRERGIIHTEALNQAAQLAGFENYRHAQRAIASGPTLQSLSYRVFLSAHWRLRSSEGRGAGRETLAIELSRPLAGIISRHQVGRARNLIDFREEFIDHLELRPNAETRELARKRLEAAARTLNFLATTSLRPATTQLQRDAMRAARDLPSRDHVSNWVDPATGDWLVLDEPYDHIASRDVERQQWAQSEGLHLVRPSWEGIYNPGHCLPYFVGTNVSFMNKIVELVEAMPKGVVIPESQWESALYFSEFVSPERLKSGKARKRRPGPSYGERLGAIPYGGAAGYPSVWPPATPMPLDSHMKIGRILHGLSSSDFPRRVLEKLSDVRSKLESWALAEHDQAITDEMFQRMYYGVHAPPFRTAAEQLAALQEVNDVLMAGYQECKPRRDILKLLDAVRNVVVGKVQ